jgi:hypothetical protein
LQVLKVISPTLAIYPCCRALRVAAFAAGHGWQLAIAASLRRLFGCHGLIQRKLAPIT